MPSFDPQTAARRNSGRLRSGYNSFMPHTRSQSGRQLYRRLLSYVRPYAAAFGVALVGMIAAAATEPLLPVAGRCGARW